MSGSNGSIRCFTSKDAPKDALRGERVAVLGYGNLGRTFALNLRDSIADPPVIGNIEDSYAKQARAEGFTVKPIGEAVANADVILVLLPDEVIPEVFAADIGPKLVPRSAILFGSGYPLAYNQISVPPDIDVLMLAPRMAGETARQRFVEKRGFYAFVSVEQDASGKAWKRLLGVAEGTGILRAGALELNAHRRGLSRPARRADDGCRAGHVDDGRPSAWAWKAVCRRKPWCWKCTCRKKWKWSSARSARRVSSTQSSVHGPTALFGGYVRTMELMGSNLTDIFQRTFEEIRNGEFERKFEAEREAGYPATENGRGVDPRRQSAEPSRGSSAGVAGRPVRARRNPLDDVGRTRAGFPSWRP